MMRYAAQTQVTSDRSRSAIEATLKRHGATAFAYGWNNSHDTMQFTLRQCTIRFTLPRVKDEAFSKTPTGRRRAAHQAEVEAERAERQRWRALLLVIRAKLEAVEAGIAMFEQEFLAFILMPSGETVGDVLVPRLRANQPLLIGKGTRE
jgi:hypothetical protein